MHNNYLISLFSKI